MTYESESECATHYTTASHKENDRTLFDQINQP